MVQDLIQSYGLLNNVTVVKSCPATEEELKSSHSSSYIDFIKSMNDCDDLEKFQDDFEEYGLEYDCEMLDKMYSFISTIAGSTLTAAKAVMSKRFQVAINWFGGWHHAQRDSAEGFCYVNDIAVAIQKMSAIFKRILYVDLDIHHGNGVQNIFETTRRVLTLSFHKYVPGFYPCTGSVEDLGFSEAKYYAMNVPFMEGLGDETYLTAFDGVFPRVHERFKPEAIVVQCGADGLNGDPLGECNLSNVAYGECLKRILAVDLPTVIVGGGGYNFPNTARLWAYLTSIVVGRTLADDIPDCCANFLEYAPSYELGVPAGNQRDANKKEYLEGVIERIKFYCDKLEC